MAKLEYSSEALNVLAKFYRADVLVYVEGDDDIPFWSAVFEQFSPEGIAITVESLGGSDQIDAYIDRVEEDGVRLIVARDCDYLDLMDKRSDNERVVYTFGHSMENSLYSPWVIAKVSGICHRKIAPKEDEVRDWLAKWATDLVPLVTFDVANEVEGLGISVLGDNCARYMKTEKGKLVCDKRVAERVSKLEAKFDPKVLRRIARRIKKYDPIGTRVLRGHVLASGVLRYVANHASQSVSNETLYMGAIGAFEKEIASHHAHRGHYEAQVIRAIDSLLAA